MFQNRKERRAQGKQGRVPEKKPSPVRMPEGLTKKERQEIEDVVRRARKNKGIPQTAQQSIPFDRIWKDGVIRVTEGYYSKTIEYEDINYQLSTQADKKSILEEWSGFLNFFDSSIHFEFSFMNALTDKLLFAKKIRIPMADDAFNDLRKEFNQMLALQLKKGNNGLTKRKFLTFGIYANNLRQAVPRLNHIQTDLINNFRQMGVEARVLDGAERLEVMHAMFHVINPEQFHFTWKYLADSGLSVKDFVAPSSFNFTGRRTMEIGEMPCAVSCLQIAASQLPDNMLKDFLDMESGQIVTIHVRSLDQNAAVKMVKHTITELDRSKIEEQKKAVRAGYDMDIIPSDLATYGRDAKSLLEELQSQDQRLFMVTFLILTTGKTKQELETNLLQVSSIAQKHSCQIIRLDYEQEPGLMSSLPLAWNQIDIERALTTSATAIMVPFTTQELFQTNDEAIYSGLNALSGNMIFLDRKRLKTPNGLILGTPGSGKSFTTKREIYSVFLSTKDDIIVCDPESEYTALVQSLNGQVIRISPNSTQSINPMDINVNYSEEDNPVALKADFILSFCELILGDRNGLQPIEKTVIDRCVHAVYDRYFLDPKPENMPILEDLYNELLRQNEHEAQRVATALELYVNGSLNIFNKRTNVDITNRVICYDIRDLGKQLKKLGMLIVQDQVWNRVTVNRYQKKTTRYYIDEFHLLLHEEQTAAYSVEIWKRFRKWGGIPTGITQNIKDLLSSREVENIFENSEYICMLNQASEDRQILAQHLGISPHQLKYVTRVGEGTGLIFYGNLILPFVDHFPKDTKMYQIMTTKLSETGDERPALGLPVGNASGANASDENDSDEGKTGADGGSEGGVELAKDTPEDSDSGTTLDEDDEMIEVPDELTKEVEALGELREDWPLIKPINFELPVEAPAGIASDNAKEEAKEKSEPETKQDADKPAKKQVKKRTTSRKKAIVLTPPDGIESLSSEEPEKPKTKPKRSKAKKTADKAPEVTEEKA